jgi:hypothetical protein
MFSAAKTSAPAVSGGLLSKSLRFRSSASAYLSRTPGGSVTNNQKCTVSLWVKRGKLSTYTTQQILMYSAAGDRIWFDVQALNTLSYYTPASYANVTGLFADPSAWYHIVLALDTTQATASNRVKFYVNGVQSTVTGAYPTLNQAIPLNTASTNQFIGGDGGGAFYDGYIADFYFIDGQALTPSSFGSTNATTGQWSPAKYTGTYGLNGSHLTFSNTTSTTTLGYDTSGNGNNWNSSGISLSTGSTYDSMNDLPVAYSATAANYAVMNPNGGTTGSTPITLSNGNLSFTYASASNKSAYSTIGITTGQFYFEAVYTTLGGTPNIGISLITQADANNYCGSGSAQYSYEPSAKRSGGSSSAYGASWTTNDVIGVAFDATNGTITFYKNGASQGVAYSGITSGTYVFGISSYNGGAGYVNFGQQPWQYTPPSGYNALNTYNLSTPNIAQGNKYMDATLYTGTLTTQSVTNAGAFKPDLVWIKSRSASTDNKLTDSVRGATKALVSNSTTAETTDTLGLTSFNSNGFTISTDTNYNNSGATYVGWQWQAGAGSSGPNTNGSITSTVSVSLTAGFSIVTYTGTGSSGQTVGHGLGIKPAFIIAKRRTGTGGWVCWQQYLTGGNEQDRYIYLDSTGASGVTSNYWGSGITSSTFGVWATGGDNNASGATLVAYCFAPIAGFSAFGSYTGNGSATGPFIYTGFQPKWLLIKATNITNYWFVFDSARNTYNSVNYLLDPNDPRAEISGALFFNFLSNGFQVTGTDGGENGSGNTYIYAAFASNPFAYSNAF